ncbi:MAG: MgtC/SapB family protein [Candidatus Acidiferrales bacterium]
MDLTMDLDVSAVLKLLVAAALGGAIGLERELHRKPAGLRTNMLICIGSALFTILSIHIAEGTGHDPGRISAQIITGIGFIGAGAIIRERGSVTGLTTAATIFVVASVGMTAGMGLYITATFVTGVILLSLSLLGWLENRLSLKTRPVAFRLTTSNLENVMAGANRALAELKIPMQHFQLFHVGPDYMMEFDADVSHSQQQAILEKLGHLDARCEVIPLEFQRE